MRSENTMPLRSGRGADKGANHERVPIGDDDDSDCDGPRRLCRRNAAGWLDSTLADAGSGIPFCDDVTARVAEFMSQYEGQAPPSDRCGGTAAVGSQPWSESDTNPRAYCVIGRCAGPDPPPAGMPVSPSLPASGEGQGVHAQCSSTGGKGAGTVRGVPEEPGAFRRPLTELSGHNRFGLLVFGGIDSDRLRRY